MEGANGDGGADAVAWVGSQEWGGVGRRVQMVMVVRMQMEIRKFKRGEDLARRTGLVTGID